MHGIVFFFGGGGRWITWNIVSDVYILTKGKKSINAEKKENVELTHTLDIHPEIAPSKPIQKNIIDTLNKSRILQHSLPLKNCSNQNVWCNSSTPQAIFDSKVFPLTLVMEVVIGWFKLQLWMWLTAFRQQTVW